jgi:hypothetical protein
MAAKDKGAAKAAKTSMADLKKVGDVGEPSLGIKVEPKNGAMGILIPRETLFASKAAIEALMRVNNLVEGNAIEPAPPVPPSKKEGPKTAPKKVAPKKAG